MMPKAKKYDVMIAGHSYCLISDEPYEHIIQSAQRLDEIMSSIAEKSRTLDTKSIAVLAALQIAHQLGTLEDRLAQECKAQEQLIAAIDQELLHKSF
jgi:cell division protein ZapA (FtsZ GTPase activity inhibitor)